MTQTPAPSLKAPTTLLMGPPGVGKTSAIPTYAKAGLKVAVLFTDPGGEQSLISACDLHSVDISQIHWHYIPPMSLTWSELSDMSAKVGLMSYADLTSLKSSGKKRETQFFKIVELLSNFKCQRTGEEFGPVDSFDDSWAFVLDSISGLNTICLDMMTGTKPVAHEGEYGTAMNMEEKLIQKLVADTRCFIALTAHVEKVINALTGEREVNVALLGKKLASTGKIARLFSDVVLAAREGDKFFWSTASADVNLKNRALPIAESLPPSFEPIVQRHREWKENAKFQYQQQQEEKQA